MKPTSVGQADTSMQGISAAENAKHNIKDTAKDTVKAPYFPLGYKDAVSQWWASISPAAAEYNVLSLIPHVRMPPNFPQVKSDSVAKSESSDTVVVDDEATTSAKSSSSNDPYGPRSWYSNMVTLSGRDRELNEFSVERDGEIVEQNLVMLHGYGAGLGFFYKNFEGLSRVKGWKVYALDMLGMGRSSRPPFRILAKDQPGKISEAEDWFIDALEEWRILRKIDKFTLLGHSMGGYMAVAYALKYPGRLNKLILASPVGIPEDPLGVEADMPDPKISTVTNEFTQSQDDTMKQRGIKKNGEVPQRRQLPRWLVYLWEANFSPFSIIRWSGPLGPRLVSGWSSRRFSHLPSDESDALHQYAYSIFRQRGSGEYVLAYVLAAGAFARNPLIHRIHKVGRKELPFDAASQSSSTPITSNGGIKKETGIPIVMMYGENDWMDVAGGYAAEEKIKEEKTRVLKDASDDERKRENGSAKVVVIRNAGHHLYLDGWEEFNHIMREEMEDTKMQGRKEKGLL